MASPLTNLSLDPKQPYGGQIDYTRISLTEATEEEAASLTPSIPNSILLFKSYINSGLHLPITPLVSRILAWFDISPSQVNANFYRAISVASVAIPYLGEDFVLTPELFVNCYKLGRKPEDTSLLKLFLIQRSLNIAPPGGRCPSSDKSWQLYPFVATGGWLQSEGAQIRTAPNRNVDFKKPPPPLYGRDAIAFDMLQREDNPEFEKFLKTAHKRKKSISTLASSIPLFPKKIKNSVNTVEKIKNSVNTVEEKRDDWKKKPTWNHDSRDTAEEKRDDWNKKPTWNHDNRDIPSSSKQNLFKNINVIELDSSSSSDDEFLCRSISAPKIQQKQTISSPSTTYISSGMNLIETGAKHLHEAQEQMRTAKGLKEENVQLKKHLHEAQEQMRTAKGLKEENVQLKAEMERLKKKCSELETKMKSDAHIATRLATEKDELSWRLETIVPEGKPYSARQKELENELEESRKLLRVCHATIKSLQESISNATRSLQHFDVYQSCSSSKSGWST